MLTETHNTFYLFGLLELCSKGNSGVHSNLWCS